MVILAKQKQTTSKYNELPLQMQSQSIIVAKVIMSHTVLQC